MFLDIANISVQQQLFIFIDSRLYYGLIKVFINVMTSSINTTFDILYFSILF
jgi:hypothetical protein